MNQARGQFTHWMDFRAKTSAMCRIDTSISKQHGVHIQCVGSTHFGRNFYLQCPKKRQPPQSRKCRNPYLQSSPAAVPTLRTAGPGPFPCCHRRPRSRCCPRREPWRATLATAGDALRLGHFQFLYVFPA
uniref:(northern house mosquito) hypothetical protein n=1 Tax=Culex pipiens TaxID=7175 RepID=A0A8D8CWS8_CULPI